MIERNDVVKIPLSEVKDEVEFAMYTALQKSKRSNTANTWQKGRSEFRKFTDLFPGDLAKNLVKKMMHSSGIALEDYDNIRTDKFLKNDKFDLRYKNKIIEVKSSLEKSDNSASTILNKRRFMIYADRNIADIIVQVYFVYVDEQGKNFFNDMEKADEKLFQSRYNISSTTDFVQRFISFSPAALIMGFITRDDAQKKKENLFVYGDKKNEGEVSRSYIEVFIKNGNPILLLPEFILNLSSSK